MRPALRLSLHALAAASLAACAGAPAPEPVQVAPVAEGRDAVGAPPRPMTGRPQLAYALPGGRHDCELGHHVGLKRDPGDAMRIDLEWQGKHYLMRRHSSSSGLPRYEHQDSGLVWIELPWKGMLLDGRSGRPLANECRPA